MLFALTGSIDPWHVLSILKNQTNGEVAVFMKGIAHCGNMNPSEPNDPISLKNGRKVCLKDPKLCKCQMDRS